MKEEMYQCLMCGCLIKYGNNRINNFECPCCTNKDFRIVSKIRLKEYRYLVPWEIEESSSSSLANDKEIITSQI